MADPRDFWNERFAQPGFVYGSEPTELVRQLGPTLVSPVLSLGEGEGRNAVFLAQQGHAVTAVDLSHTGLEKAQALAASRGVAITTQVADLADYDLGEARWATIIAIWCHLPPWVRAPVHRAIARALLPGGRLVLQAYTPRQLAFDTGGPKNAELLYEPDEVRAELVGLVIDRCVELERDVFEGTWHRGKSAVLQVLAHRA